MDKNQHQNQHQTPDQVRRHRRFTVDLMGIQSRAVFAIGVVIQDISITGISLITDQKMEIGAAYNLRLFDDKLDIPLQATVVRSAELVEANSPADPADSAPASYLTGMQFHDCSPEVVTSLEQFIKSHLIGNRTLADFHLLSGCRYNVRFHVDSNKTVLLDVQENYKVKKLGLGGMLIESSHPFELETRFHMETTIPGGKNLSFAGRVASCIPSAEQSGRFDVGIEFVHMADEDRAELKAFIKELYIKDAGF